MKRSLKILGVATVIAVGVAAAPFELAVGDIVGSIVDDHVGIITNHAIRAVKALPSGSGTVGSTLDRRTPRPRWRALHDDDDSLFSVRVSAGDADWCVAYSLIGRPIPHMKISDIAPATRAAQVVSGSLGTLYSDLPTNSSWACSAIRTYFQKSSPDALFRHSGGSEPCETLVEPESLGQRPRH